MAPAREHHLAVTRTARYHTLGEASPAIREAWFVLHGHAQLSEYFIRHFAVLDDGTRLIVAPEGLNRFYLDVTTFTGAGQARVGATWMTKEDRLTEIADYTGYLDRLYDQVFTELDRSAVRVVMLGFSQGVTTGCRWLCRGRARADTAVLWAGPVPTELTAETAAPLRAMKVLRVLGESDEMNAAEHLDGEQRRVAAIGLGTDLIRFDGGHRIDPELLRSLPGLSLPVVLLAQISIGAQAIPMLSHADRVPGGGTLTELRVSQPILFGSAAPFGGRLQLHVMLDFEGATMPNGQLATGVFGEGFNDKRHPHTYAHELIASWQDPLRVPGISWSLTAGKGFAPYGTDDPMNRPALVFPINHHWSQVLERAVAIGAVRRGIVTLEVGLFNGDEPEYPSQWPSWSRFGDSWSARALVHPNAWLELQGSYAHVKSPEHRPGAGLTHDKVSVSARVERTTRAGDAYLMAEWAHESEEGFFEYSTALVEAQLSGRSHRGYLRFEHTDRPEETRLITDLFRSVRPHTENSNLGASRWNALTGGYGLTPRLGWPVRFEAIAEGSYLHVAKAGGGVFDPLTLWGRNDLWMASVAVRIQAGARVHRMGRYGVAAGDGHHPSPSAHGH